MVKKNKNEKEKDNQQKLENNQLILFEKPVNKNPKTPGQLRYYKLLLLFNIPFALLLGILWSLLYYNTTNENFDKKYTLALYFSPLCLVFFSIFQYILMKYCCDKYTIFITFGISMGLFLFWTLSVYVFWIPTTTYNSLYKKYGVTLVEKHDITTINPKTNYKKGEYYILLFKENSTGAILPGCQADYEEFPQAEYSIVHRSTYIDCGVPPLDQLKLGNCMKLNNKATQFNTIGYGYQFIEKRKCKYISLIFNLDPMYHGPGIPILYCILGASFFLWSAQIIIILWFKVYRSDWKDWIFLTFCTSKTELYVPQKNKTIMIYETLGKDIDYQKIVNQSQTAFDIPQNKVYISGVVRDYNTNHIKKAILQEKNDDLKLLYMILALKSSLVLRVDIVEAITLVNLSKQNIQSIKQMPYYHNYPYQLQNTHNNYKETTRSEKVTIDSNQDKEEECLPLENPLNEIQVNISTKSQKKPNKIQHKKEKKSRGKSKKMRKKRNESKKDEDDEKEEEEEEFQMEENDKDILEINEKKSEAYKAYIGKDVKQNKKKFNMEQQEINQLMKIKVLSFKSESNSEEVQDDYKSDFE